MRATTRRSSRSTAATCSACCSTPGVERAGAEALSTGWRCTGFAQDERGVTRARSTIRAAERPRPPQQADIVVGCDGMHSAIRKQLHPGEGAPRYSRRQHVARRHAWKPILGGATMIRAGWLSHGKMVIYPIRDDIDASGTQLVNWVAEIETRDVPPARLEPARPARRLHRRLRGLALRLARRAGADSRRRRRCSSSRWSTRIRCPGGRRAA